MGMGIMLLFPLIMSLLDGSLDKLINPTQVIQNWRYITYIILLTCFCGYVSGKLASYKIIKKDKDYLRSGMLGSVFSLIIFGFFSMIPTAVEMIYIDSELSSEFLFIIIASTLAITIVGSIPAVFVGFYLGNSINKKRIQLKL